MSDQALTMISVFCLGFVTSEVFGWFVHRYRMRIRADIDADLAKMEALMVEVRRMRKEGGA